MYRTTKGKLSDAVTSLKTAKTGNVYTETDLPVFTLGANGKKGMTQRQCTTNYKIRQIRKEIRKHIKIKHKAFQWLGISTDEAARIKPSRVAYLINHYPLIDLNMSRQDCLDWMKSKGFPTPPRSACYYCPFHSDAEWLSLSKEDFKRACDFEKRIQNAYEQTSEITSVPYLHSKRIPLEEVELNDKTNNMNNYYEIHDQDFNRDGISSGWIQWKGTDVCIDLHCICGYHGHVDAEFFYRYECIECGRKFAVGQNIKLIELTEDQYDDTDNFFKDTPERDEVPHELFTT